MWTIEKVNIGHNRRIILHLLFELYNTCLSSPVTYDTFVNTQWLDEISSASSSEPHAMRDHFLSMSSSKAWASGDHFLFLFFLSPDFRGLWPSVMNICPLKLSSNVRVSALLVSLNALQLALVDRNPLQPCSLSFFLLPDIHEIYTSSK